MKRMVFQVSTFHCLRQPIEGASNHFSDVTSCLWRIHKRRGRIGFSWTRPSSLPVGSGQPVDSDHLFYAPEFGVGGHQLTLAVLCKGGGKGIRLATSSRGCRFSPVSRAHSFSFAGSRASDTACFVRSSGFSRSTPRPPKGGTPNQAALVLPAGGLCHWPEGQAWSSRHPQVLAQVAPRV